MSPSSTVHGGQHNKYVTFELLLHSTLTADEIWGFMLEPAARTMVDDKMADEPPRQHTMDPKTMHPQKFTHRT